MCRCFQFLNKNFILICVVFVTVLVVLYFMLNHLGGALSKESTVLNYILGCYSNARMCGYWHWWYCILLLHCQSIVRTIWWISTRPSQLFQLCVLFFVYISCDCFQLHFCWDCLSCTSNFVSQNRLSWQISLLIINN